MSFESNPSQAQDPEATAPTEPATQESVAASPAQPSAQEIPAPPPTSPSDSARPLPPSASPAPDPEPPPRPGEESVLTEEMTVLGNSPVLLRKLPITQYRVLIELWAGRSIRHAAEICDIHRVTVHRWMREDARFIAALNQAQESNLQEVTARMSGLAAKSMDKLSNAVDHGDMSAAKFVINHVTKNRPGPQSPRVIAKRIRRRHQRLEEYLNSPDEAPAPPVITSSINEPPAPAALPPVVEEKHEEQKGETPPSTPEAPQTRENEV